MIRTYEIQHHMNEQQKQQVLLVLLFYRATCGRIAVSQWRDFFEKETQFNKMCAVKQIPSLLSERYKRNCAYQVNGTLSSFMKNVQGKFKDIVYHSKLHPDTRKHLFQINKRQIWLHKEHDLFIPNELFLAKKIFKQILGWYRKPRFGHQNMLLNCSVAHIIQPANAADDYYIKLSTITKGKPILISLSANEYFNSKEGKLSSSVQINQRPDGTIKISLMKDITCRTIAFRSDKISIDIGLKTLFALNTGHLYGRNFYDKLAKYDRILTNLAANRQRQGFKTKSRRYNLLTRRLKDYLKNEICRLLNRIIKQHSPKEIVIEKLDFRNQNLSKKFNRIISKFGKRIIEDKLKSISEEYNIVITKVNPAYTSQTCDSCGYVSPNNRTTQAEFKCGCCHKKNHADVVAARNHLVRSSDKELCGIYLDKNFILRKLVMRYAERLPRPCSWAKGLLSENPYFQRYGNLRTA